MHREVLTTEQQTLLPSLKVFSNDFGLVGGTAVALHIGHRESIDFDLFTKDPAYEFDASDLRRRFSRLSIIGSIIRERDVELTLHTKTGIQVTFFHFPHVIPFTETIDRVLDMPNLLTLAAMKAYALGFRSKWKDYVDLYFIMRDFHSINEISARAQELFKGEFNERLFRQQLGFFDDINYKEPVTYKPGFAVPDEEIKKFLSNVSVS